MEMEVLVYSSSSTLSGSSSLKGEFGARRGRSKGAGLVIVCEARASFCVRKWAGLYLLVGDGIVLGLLSSYSAMGMWWKLSMLFWFKTTRDEPFETLASL